MRYKSSLILLSCLAVCISTSNARTLEQLADQYVSILTTEKRAFVEELTDPTALQMIPREQLSLFSLVGFTELRSKEDCRCCCYALKADEYINDNLIYCVKPTHKFTIESDGCHSRVKYAVENNGDFYIVEPAYTDSRFIDIQEHCLRFINTAIRYYMSLTQEDIDNLSERIDKEGEMKVACDISVDACISIDSSSMVVNLIIAHK